MLRDARKLQCMGVGEKQGFTKPFAKVTITRAAAKAWLFAGRWDASATRGEYP